MIYSEKRCLSYPDTSKRAAVLWPKFQGNRKRETVQALLPPDQEFERCPTIYSGCWTVNPSASIPSRSSETYRGSTARLGPIHCHDSVATCSSIHSRAAAIMGVIMAIEP